MSWTGNEEDLEEFICPITNDIFKDPVLASDGKTYEREGIELWMTSCTQRRLPITSPLTREQMGSNLMEDTEMVRRLRDRR
ncbi:hypothetical protein T484DRAFT_1766373 [Baffinella frigidus]|nr:hypothetical protein T484DRAFT_1766373 [Cryptophyta sp. CCMP2293]